MGICQPGSYKSHHGTQTGLQCPCMALVQSSSLKQAADCWLSKRLLAVTLATSTALCPVFSAQGQQMENQQTFYLYLIMKLCVCTLIGEVQFRAPILSADVPLYVHSRQCHEIKKGKGMYVP